MMKTNKEPIIPAAREDDLIVQEMADEVLVYDQRRHRAHCLNETAAMVWRSLDGKSTASDVAARLSRERRLAVETGLVQLAVEELRRSDLLQGPIESGKSGVSRREMMKRVGIGAAIALPVVVSIV